MDLEDVVRVLFYGNFRDVSLHARVLHDHGLMIGCHGIFFRGAGLAIKLSVI